MGYVPPPPSRDRLICYVEKYSFVDPDHINVIAGSGLPTLEKSDAALDQHAVGTSAQKL